MGASKIHAEKIEILAAQSSRRAFSVSLQVYKALFRVLKGVHNLPAIVLTIVQIGNESQVLTPVGKLREGAGSEVGQAAAKTEFNT